MILRRIIYRSSQETRPRSDAAISILRGISLPLPAYDGTFPFADSQIILIARETNHSSYTKSGTFISGYITIDFVFVLCECKICSVTIICLNLR